MVNNFKSVLSGIFSAVLLVSGIYFFMATGRTEFPSEDYSSPLEKQIRSGKTSTAAEIVPYHPRVWLRGAPDWDKDIFGSYAWRIVHGPAMSVRFPAFAHDDLKYIFYFTAEVADKYFDDISWHDTHLRLLSLITAGKSVRMKKEWNLPSDLPGTSQNPDYRPQHTADEYYIRAKEKLLFLANSSVGRIHSDFMVQVGAAAYDWLMGETLENGEPVLSDKERRTLQNRLIAHADYLKKQCSGKEHFFQSSEIYNYMYPQVGFALYEPDGRYIDPEYNQKAKEYLDDFDRYWIGKILPALNAQGGDGGWHGGITRTTGRPGMQGGTPADNTVPIVIAPLLFAHFTATGREIEESVFSTGCIKNFTLWQLYMIPPCRIGEATYYSIGGGWKPDNRSPWTFPRQLFARRRASKDPEQLRLAELGAWLGYQQANFCIGYGGSWDNENRLLFEDNWVNPRDPERLGYGTQHFRKLGWVFMREKFTTPNDVSAIFVCQDYRWSHLDQVTQNSIHIGRSEDLVTGWDNTIWIGEDGRRSIEKFPTINDGMEAYAPGSEYDIGPGIQSYQDNDQYTYVFGDASNAYEKDKLKKFTREIVYLKPAIFIILDQVETRQAGFKKSWVIHPSAAPQSIDSSFTIIQNGSSALWIKRLLPIRVNQTLDSNLMEVSPNQSALKDQFLYVMQVTNSNVSKDSPEVVADQATLIPDANRIRIKVDKWEVVFNANNTPGISITASTKKKEQKN